MHGVKFNFEFIQATSPTLAQLWRVNFLCRSNLFGSVCFASDKQIGGYSRNTYNLIRPLNSVLESLCDVSLCSQEGNSCPRRLFMKLKDYVLN